MQKIRAGVIGATGLVGQRFVRILANHSWFTLAALAASDGSAGLRYQDACQWRSPLEMPEAAKDLRVEKAVPDLPCELIFSAVPARSAATLEPAFARAGYTVVSNASAHRLDDDVPLLIPEVNPEHLHVLRQQRRTRHLGSGCLVTNPNCVVAQLALALAPMHRIWGVRQVIVTTLQALSGAGYPGPSAFEVTGNVIPNIPGEEEKIQTEPAKILGAFHGAGFEFAKMEISASVNRVAVPVGHLASVAVKLSRRARLHEILEALQGFRGLPQELELPLAPRQPIRVRTAPDRPQPARDHLAGNGMTVTVGNLRACPVLDFKFSLLGHNMMRGAAGGAVLIAELLKAQGYIYPEAACSGSVTARPGRISKDSLA